MNSSCFARCLVLRITPCLTALILAIGLLSLASAAVLYTVGRSSTITPEAVALAGGILLCAGAVVGAVAIAVGFAFEDLRRHFEGQGVVTNRLQTQFGSLVRDLGRSEPVRHTPSNDVGYASMPAAVGGQPVGASPESSVEVRQDDTPAADRCVSPRVAATASRAAGPDLPRVSIGRDVLATVHRYVTGFLEARGAALEAGGVLVGEFVGPDGACTEVRIRGFIDAGPGVRATPGSIDFDLPYVNRRLRALRTQHPWLAHVGAIHRHPGSLDVCSGGDKVTDREAVVAAPSRCLVFGIITLGNRAPTAEAILFRDFTVNFYLMSAATDFEYVPVRPEVCDLPLVELSAGHARLLDLRGESVPLDLEALRSVEGFKGATLDVATHAGAEAAACFVEFGQIPGRLALLAGRDGSTKAQWEGVDGSRQRVRGSWDAPATGAHVWLTEVALRALESRRPMETIAYSRHHTPWFIEKPGRVVVEVQAMRQKYGDRAELVRDGNVLFWRYVVRESGRQLPVRVVYPDAYPVIPPYIVSELSLPSTPHQLGSGRLCWTDGSHWLPSRDTAVICINAAHRWYAAMLVFLTKGKWPKGAEHR